MFVPSVVVFLKQKTTIKLEYEGKAINTFENLAIDTIKHVITSIVLEKASANLKWLTYIHEVLIKFISYFFSNFLLDLRLLGFLF